MKRFILLNVLLVCALSVSLFARTEEEYQKDLDKQKDQLKIESDTLMGKVKNNKTAVIEYVKQLNLDKNRSKFLPYQTSINFNKNDKVLILEKQSLIKDDAFKKETTGVAKKILKVYTDDLAKDPSKLEITIQEENYFGDKEYIVISFEPATSETPTFKRFYNGKEMPLQKKEDSKTDKVAEIKSKKIENEKIELVNSHLEYFKDSLRFIVEADKKSVGDSDVLMNLFLRKGKDF